MSIKKIKIQTEYIKLDQFLKWAEVTSSGAESKALILDKKVMVNDSIEIQRGKKLRPGDRIIVGDETFEIE